MFPSFGRYRVLDEIGRGGMGVVYRAVDPELDREVAIKHIQLPPDASREVRDELEKRFRREAKAAARIRHPGVVAIHDVGTTDSGLYLVMELVDGESLANRLERGAFPERAAAIELATRAAEALAAAHRAGVVHRDVKPANILISRDGRALLTDFGVARSLDEVSELTRTGMVVGSPAYMAPEQLRGGEVDGRVDLFSLGVVLYEMLLHKRPFPAQSITTLLYQILHEDPLADPGISRELDMPTAEVLRRLLAKDAGDRFGDAPAVVAALRQLPLEATSADDAPTRPQIPIVPLVPPALPTPPGARTVSVQPGAGGAAPPYRYTPPGASPLPPPAAAPPRPPPPPPAPPIYGAAPPASPPYGSGPTPGPMPPEGSTPPLSYPGAAAAYASAAPTPYATPGAPRRTALLLVASTVIAALVVVVAVLALWSRSPGRPVVQPTQPAGWTPGDGPLLDAPLPAPPTPTPLPLAPAPAAPTPSGVVAPPDGQPMPQPGQTAPPGQPAPLPTQAEPAPIPTTPPPAATEPPAPQPAPQPPPSENVSGRVRARRGVEFDVSPGDAQVYLDGRPLGAADDVEQYEITTPGRHLLRFTAPGYKPALVEVEITQDVRTRWAEVEVELEEIPEPE